MDGSRKMFWKKMDGNNGHRGKFTSSASLPPTRPLINEVSNYNPL